MAALLIRHVVGNRWELVTSHDGRPPYDRIGDPSDRVTIQRRYDDVNGGGTGHYVVPAAPERPETGEGDMTLWDTPQPN